MQKKAQKNHNVWIKKLFDNFSEIINQQDEC